MVDNVQCPVCTLYLHAGMNLSDHLETHPKEQVIKALVQMTIASNNGVGSGLATAVLSGSKTATDGAARSTSSSTNAPDVKPVVTSVSPTSSSPSSTAVTTTAPKLVATKNALPSCSTSNSISGSNCSTSSSSSSSSTSSGNSSSSCSNKLSNPPIKAIKSAPPSTEAPANASNTPTTNSITAIYSEYRYDQHQQQVAPATTTLHGFARGTATLVIPQAPHQQQHQYLAAQQQSAHFPHHPHQQQQQQPQQPQQQQQQQQHQHQHQHQQSPMKYTYAAALPPPPPLQLFAQQVTPSQSHQKPPPAYGAAISQIRSQHNQNKQQQQQQSQQQITLQQGVNLTPPSGKHNKLHTDIFLNPPPPPPPQIAIPSTSSTASLRLQYPPQQQQTLAANSNNYVASNCPGSSSGLISSSTTFGRASTSRQTTNSPFGALLNAAAQAACASPASSSAGVLRYAESPVAHYLERENGDFIVQETPKHIVECVEKEDGQFSVIERIYQSPPSVLHIHDDDEDDEEGNEENDDNGKGWANSDAEDQMKVEDHFQDGDDEHEDSQSRAPHKTTTKKSRKAKTNVRKHKRTNKHQLEDEDDFMSIGSSCAEEEHQSDQQQQQTHLPQLPGSPAGQLSTAPSTSSAAAAAAAAAATAAAAAAAAAAATAGSSTSSSSTPSGTTKSKKNRVTVLSDVPLNMNEYLDLVGNIVASSRIGAARPFAAVAPIPMVKVEKEEPIDEYDSVRAEMSAAEQKSSLDNASGSSNSSNSGHGTTSVIRMASTSSSAAVANDDLTQPPPMKVEVEPTVLLPQRFSAPAQHRGPKKLVIKPKAKSSTTATATTASTSASVTVTSTASTKKTDNNADCSSTSSSGSSGNNSADTPSISSKAATEPLQIKSENLEALSTNGSILEKHLTNSYAAQQARKHSAVNDDDARVLLEFANSKQQPPAGNSNQTTFVVNAASFASVGSVFASGSSGSSNVQKSSKAGEEYILPDNNLEVNEIVISSSSSYTSDSQHAQLPEQQLQEQSQQQQIQHSVQQSQQPSSFTDFNFLYHQNATTSLAANGTAAASSASPFAPFGMQQQQQQHLLQHPQHGSSEATNAATLASSSSNLSALDQDSSMNATFRVTRQQHTAGPWYHHQQQQEQQQQPQTSTSQSSNVDQSNHFMAALAAVDCCSAAAVDSDVSEAKYLDLDTCKREQLSNSSSHMPSASASTTSSSFAAAATESSLVGGLSLNIRTDEKMPAKGEISEQESNCDIENSWSQSMYGDLSQRYFRNQFTDGYNQQLNDFRQDYYPAQDLSGQHQQQQSEHEQKRFDFNSVASEYLQSGHMEASTSSSRNNHLLDAQPTTSSSSSAMLAGPPIASTSRAAAEAEAVAAALAQRKPPRRKIYKCPHCVAIFEKLKERNAHMIGEHNYVRQNRRLICTQALVNTTMTQSQEQHVQEQQQHQLLQASEHDLQEDSKDGIVKIKQEQCQDKQDLSEQQLGHSELPDVKDASLLDGSNEHGRETDTKPPTGVVDLDEKPTMAPLSMTTPAAKLAALYRMLIAYNESKLGQDRNNLSELEKKAMEKSIFLCYVCRTDFPSVKLYDAHLTEHPAECFTCGKKFYRWKNFSLHLKRHLGWKEFGCYVCDKKFVVRSALVEHMRMHTGQTPLKCKICGKKFKRYSNLTQHRKRHTRIMVRKKEYVCHCGEVLPSKARFLWHKETHDLKPKCCPYCCDRFVHANSLRRHIRLAHSDKFDYAEPMECPMCKQIFAKTSIKAHMATHSTDPQYDCAICNKSFSTKWNLKIHSWVHANRTAKPFKCEYCPKAFVRELDFKNHMNAHKQIKPYTCEYCGCKFIRKYNYMRHRREHHGNKKFTCELCDKSFHRHYYLIEHRRIHTGERPFHCTICGKSSTTKTNHNKHLKIHHSRDPFTVEV